MNDKDWQEILHLMSIQKNVALAELDNSNYGSNVYYQCRGTVKGIEICEQYIIARLGKEKDNA